MFRLTIALSAFWSIMTKKNHYFANHSVESYAGRKADIAGIRWHANKAYKNIVGGSRYVSIRKIYIPFVWSSTTPTQPEPKECAICEREHNDSCPGRPNICQRCFDEESSARGQQFGTRKAENQ